MPLYDFRCAGCAAEREVTLPLRAADDLTLICVTCGGTMCRALSRVSRLIIAASPSRPAPEGGRGGERDGAFGINTCEGRAVRLTRPNPLATDLPGAPGGGAA